MTGLRISDVHFTSAHADDRGQGLLGFLSCVVDGQLKLDGITLRQTRDGRLTLAFPERRDSAGRRHPYVRPVDDAARAAIEHEILQALSLPTESAP